MQNILICFCNLGNHMENHRIKLYLSYNFSFSLDMVRVCAILDRESVCLWYLILILILNPTISEF